MKGRFRRVTLVASLAGIAVLALTGTASATFHLNRIREIHRGPAGVGDYLELQSFGAGENFVGGKYINTYDGGGTLLSSSLIANNVANASNNATILIANTPTINGTIVPDQYAPGMMIDNTGGAVCYSESPLGTAPALDCVAIGDLADVTPPMFPTPPPSPYGTPIPLPNGLQDNTTLVRTISRGCPTLFDAADDTDNSAADFSLGTGNPRPNSVAPTETPCAPVTNKTKCKKKKKSKKRSAEVAKKKKCKKKHKKH